MHIGVVLRLAPDLSGDIELTNDRRSIDLEWMDVKLNEFDDHALEEAILIKETHGAAVTVIALEGDGVDRLLQAALARGADHALKIGWDGDTNRDSRSFAPLVAELARKFGFDLLLTGLQAPDDTFGQLAAYVGAVLGWPHVSAVAGVSVGGGGLEVRQEYSGGYSAVLAISLPAVIGIQTASQPPRYVSGSRLRQVMGVPISSVAPSVEPCNNIAQLRQLKKPEVTGSAQMLEGGAAVVAGKIRAVLVERGLVKA